MPRRELKMLLVRLLLAVGAIGVLYYFFDFSKINAKVLTGVSGFFGVISALFYKIDGTDSIFQDQTIIEYELELDLNRTLNHRIAYFRFYWWVSIISSSVVFILSLLLEFNPDLIANIKAIYFACFVLLAINVPAAISFIMAIFDCKDTIRELRSQQRKRLRYLNSENKDSSISRLPSL